MSPDDEPAVDEEALAARRVARACARARSRRRRRRRGRPGRGRRARSRRCRCVRATHGASSRCTCTGQLDPLEQAGDALDRVAHHRAADVVGVVVRGEHAADDHAVGLDGVDEVVDGVRRVDEQALAGRPVADGVDEVDHLRRPRDRRRRSRGRTAAGGSTGGRYEATRSPYAGGRDGRRDPLRHHRHGNDGRRAHPATSSPSTAPSSRRSPTPTSARSTGRTTPSASTPRSPASPTTVELLDSRRCATPSSSPRRTTPTVDIARTTSSPPTLHVLVEKPLCTTVGRLPRGRSSAARSRSARPRRVDRAGVPLHAADARLLAEVRGGTVGDVRMVAIREHRFPFLHKVGNWNRFNRNTGGTLVEKCCHFFDLMNLVVGAAPGAGLWRRAARTSTTSTSATTASVPDILDNAYVIVDYDGGARGAARPVHVRRGEQERAGDLASSATRARSRRWSPRACCASAGAPTGSARSTEHARHRRPGAVPGLPPRLQLPRARRLPRRHPRRHARRRDARGRPVGRSPSGRPRTDRSTSAAGSSVAELVGGDAIG